MNSSDIVYLRLHNQSLAEPRFQEPKDVVGWLGAVQAQDYAAAKWALGLRMRRATDEIIEKSLNEGEILRTHVMRPTWHFVLPEDIRWMLELTAPQVKKLLASYNRKLGLDDKLFAKSNAAIAKALKGNSYLTRQELKKILEGIGIRTDVQRLAHIVMWAELDALICSGPRRGKQFTYALLEERVPRAKKINRDEALAKLTLKYFTSHGPAQIKDFVWWSGLAFKDAEKGLDAVKSQLTQEIIEDKTYYVSKSLPRAYDMRPSAFLLSVYDEYAIAYKDRSDISNTRDIERMISMGNALTAVIIIDGRAAGTWKREMRKDSVIVTLQTFSKLASGEKKMLVAAATRYGDFISMPVVLRQTD
jgi:hypothetical protein